MRQRNVPNKDPYLLLSNPIANAALDIEGYRRRVATFLARAPDNNFEQHFKHLLEKPRFESAFNSSIKRFKDLHPSLYRSRISLERFWIIYKCLLVKRAGEVSEYSRYRDCVENGLLVGNYESVESALSACNEQFGESLWYIKCKILLLSLQGRQEELKIFCESMKGEINDSLTRYVVNCMELISSSDNAELHLRTLVLETANELNQGRATDVGSLLATLLSPIPLAGRFSHIDAIALFQTYPLIDLYNLVVMAIIHGINDPFQRDRIPRKIVSELTSAIDDSLIKHIESWLLKPANTETSEVGLLLLTQYESGEYEAVSETFDSRHAELFNPLGYVNLVAKANAYIGKRNPKAHSNVLNSIIDELTSIYCLEGSQTHIEQILASRVIKFHGTISGLLLQFSIYKALPNRFPLMDVQYAAAIAASSQRENTSMTMSMATPNTSVFREEYANHAKSLPMYRETKRKIINAVLNGENGVGVRELLIQYRAQSPLKKDYLELYSSYCLKTEKMEELIDEAAEFLVENLSFIGCLPMEAMIQTIELQQLSSIASVVVSHFYVRNRSAKKDYVLNESFEEYVLNHSVQKPSELLQSQHTLNEIDIVFYRNVCTQEVLDFLSCFDNVNQLRAERVRILDLLLEKQLVKPEVRMEEVEDIVWEEIIDAGTTEFNGAKVFVDDLAIRRKVNAPIATLLDIYRQATDNGGDQLQITLLDEEFETPGKSYAFVSGSKGSIALKMWNIVMDGFLHDEQHGLDKNLSGEIRHGFFSNLMHARLEERKLITEADEHGRYESNIYWREQNVFLVDSCWETIDEELRTFSAAFNSLVASAEQWMQIGNDKDDQAQLFKYFLPLEDFEVLQQVVDSAESADQIVEHVLNVLWSSTEQHLGTIKEKLNADFQNSVDTLFDALVIGINEARGGAALVQLMSAISLARDEIKEDIARASDWFQRTENREIAVQSLDQAIEMAIHAFEQVKGAAFSISRSLSQELKSEPFPAHSVKPFIIAIINLLDNCYRRSGLAQNTSVEISSASKLGGAEIIIKNSLSIERSVALSDEAIREIAEKMHGPSAGVLMRTEGGSGITKAHKLISSLGAGSSIRIARDHDSFMCVIDYER